MPGSVLFRLLEDVEIVFQSVELNVLILYFLSLPKSFGQIKIDDGFVEWKNLVIESMQLIKTTDSLKYDFLVTHCDRISFWNGEFSTTEDSSIVISTYDLKSKSKNNVACVLVHESKHLELSKTKNLTQSAEECIAYRYELDFLMKLKEPESHLIQNCFKFLNKFCD